MKIQQQIPTLNLPRVLVFNAHRTGSNKQNRSTWTEETIMQYVSYYFQGGTFLNLFRVTTETTLVPSLDTLDKSWCYYCMTCYQLFISQPSY
jgi:hypothetical protein